MAVSKVVLNGDTLMDVTQDSVTDGVLLKDETATMANGVRTTGTVTVPTKTSDLTNDSGFITGMTILSYGSSTWQNFLDAYNANKVVYCRASSNTDPSTGNQGRLAFMAFVNLSGTTPTSVEFQYYRSVSSHSDSQQGDQVYIYKLQSTGWTVTVREAYTKIAAGTGLSSSYGSGTLTLSSSGGSAGLKVTCTQSASYPYTITADKTYGDIVGAFNNGINVIVVLGANKIYLLDRITSSYISFSHPQYVETYGTYYYQDTIVFNSNDTITTSRGSFPAATDSNIENALYNLGVKPSVMFLFEYSSSGGLVLNYIDAPYGSPHDFFETGYPAMANLEVTVYDDLGDVSHFDIYNCAKVWGGYGSESDGFIGHAIFSRSRVSVDPDKIYIDEVEIVWDEEMDTCTAEGRTAEVAATAISSIYPISE